MAQGIEELVCRPDDLNLSLGLYRVTAEKCISIVVLLAFTCALVRHTLIHITS